MVVMVVVVVLLVLKVVVVAGFGISINRDKVVCPSCCERVSVCVCVGAVRSSPSLIPASLSLPPTTKTFVFVLVSQGVNVQSSSKVMSHQLTPVEG